MMRLSYGTSIVCENAFLISRRRETLMIILQSGKDKVVI